MVQGAGLVNWGFLNDGGDFIGHFSDNVAQ